MIETYLLLQSGGGGAGGGCASSLIQMAPLAIIFLIIWFLLIRPQRKKYEQHQEFLDQLKTGDEVVTDGGLFGKIERLDDDEVRLRVGGDTTLRVMKSKISGPADEAGEDDE